MARKAWVPPRDEQGRLIVDGYARMSVGFDGKEENVENQLDDIRAIVERNGWVLAEQLADGLSAWKPGVRRPGWEKLLERLEQGATGGVVIWHQDRLMRQPRDLEALFSLADERPEMGLASAHGKHDLTDPHQRFIMRNIVAHACLSSDDTSRRSRRKNEGRRARGQLVNGGPRPFAWPGKGVSDERLRAEQELLRWAFDHLLEGGSLGDVVRKWNASGLRAHFGRDWTTITVRQTMSKGRHVGRIEHQGEVVGMLADFEPAIDVDKFDRVQAIFASRRRGRQATERYLASGLVYCGRCGMKLLSRPQWRGGGKSVLSYRCSRPKGCSLSILQAPLDAWLRTFTILRLSDPKAAKRISKVAARRNAEIEKLRQELATAQENETSLAVKYASGLLSEAAWQAAHRVTFTRVTELGDKLAQLESAASDVEAERFQSREEVAQDWDKAQAAGDIESLRRMVKAALQSAGEVQVLPTAGRGGRTQPPVDRIRFVPFEK